MYTYMKTHANTAAYIHKLTKMNTKYTHTHFYTGLHIHNNEMGICLSLIYIFNFSV